jgi:hypothetical protein
MGRSIGISVLCVGLAIMATAQAATVLRFDVKELTTRAVVILHAKVVSKQARKSKSGKIFTDLRLQVLDAVAGAKGSIYSFSIYGGVVGDTGSTIAGAARYDVGEEILVFLDKSNKYGLRTAIGLAQGKFTIRVVDGKKMAYRDLEDLRYYDPKTGAVVEAKPDQARSFDELLAAVKRRLKKGKQR